MAMLSAGVVYENTEVLFDKLHGHNRAFIRIVNEVAGGDDVMNNHDDLRQKGQWFKDITIHFLDDSNSKEEVRNGHKYAAAKFDKNYSLLKELADQYQVAYCASKEEIAAKIDEKFNQTACLVQYYCDQMERIIMIWSRKTGRPSIVCDDSPGFIFYDPSTDCTVDMPREEVSNLGEKTKNLLQEATS